MVFHLTVNSLVVITFVQLPIYFKVVHPFVITSPLMQRQFYAVTRMNTSHCFAWYVDPISILMKRNVKVEDSLTTLKPVLHIARTVGHEYRPICIGIACHIHGTLYPHVERACKMLAYRESASNDVC
jgi:hypothetical protein